MRTATPVAPGATPVVSPARSPGCGNAVPLLLTRAPIVTCVALESLAAGDIAMLSSRVNVSGRSRTVFRSTASGIRPPVGRANTKTASSGAACAASAGSSVTTPLTEPAFAALLAVAVVDSPGARATAALADATGGSATPAA